MHGTELWSIAQMENAICVILLVYEVKGSTSEK